MIIGITGGIAAGKSTVAKLLNKLTNAEIINVDELGWKMLGKKKKQLLEIFGNKILTGNKIDRKKLGEIVFANEKKLKLLNSVVHPEIIKEIKKIIENTPQKTIKIIDCALIYEWKIEKWFDKILLVTTTYENRIKRVKKLKYDKKIIDNIIKIQTVNYTENNTADIIVKNDSDVKNLASELRKTWMAWAKNKKIKKKI